MRAHTLFQHSFFDKGIVRSRDTSLFQHLHLGFKCSSLPAHMEGKHSCVLERHLTISPPSTLQHLERKQVPVREGIIPRQASGPRGQGAESHHLPVSAHHLPGQDSRTMIQYSALIQNSDGSYGGWEYSIITALAHNMNFKLDIRPPADGERWGRNVNGTFTGTM